jgi:hypothetical protein
MNTATKATLLSALLFPGWGQLYLKRYKRGLLFILPVLAGILALAWAVAQVAMAIIKTTPFKKGTVQLSNVIQVTVDAVKAFDLFNFLLIVIFLAALWILSILDAYLLGKKLLTASTTTAVDQESTSNQA